MNMTKVIFILDDNYQHAAIYVNNQKYGDIESLGYNPSFPSTWFDLIKTVRKFEQLTVYHLSKYGVQQYLRDKHPFPEQLSDFKVNELHLEEL